MKNEISNSILNFQEKNEEMLLKYLCNENVFVFKN